MNISDRYWLWVYRRSERHVLAGVKVGILWPSSDERDTCIPKIEAALELIRRHDARRYGRFRRDVDGILIIGAAGPLARWHSTTRLVVVQQSFVSRDETSVAMLAATLVHEGAHAWLTRLGFDYAPELRERIEAVCFRSEITFARRLPEPADLIARAERQLARDPEFWTPEAFRSRQLGELEELRVPRWIVSVIGRIAGRT